MNYDSMRKNLEERKAKLDDFINFLDIKFEDLNIENPQIIETLEKLRFMSNKMLEGERFLLNSVEEFEKEKNG